MTHVQWLHDNQRPLVKGIFTALNLALFFDFQQQGQLNSTIFSSFHKHVLPMVVMECRNILTTNTIGLHLENLVFRFICWDFSNLWNALVNKDGTTTEHQMKDIRKEEAFILFAYYDCRVSYSSSN